MLCAAYFDPASESRDERTKRLAEWAINGKEEVNGNRDFHGKGHVNQKNGIEGMEKTNGVSGHKIFP